MPPCRTARRSAAADEEEQMPTIATTPGRRRNRRVLAIGIVAALVLAGCGSSSGDDAKDVKTTEAKATTTTEAKATTTEPSKDDEDEPADGEATDGLPTDEADAPSGDWISVRFLVAQDPEPDGFNPGSAEARVYDIESDCSESDGCSLRLAGGGEDGGFELPGTEPISGDDIVLEPNDGEWTGFYVYPDDIGCTEELDGPYIESTENRTMKPVYDEDGNMTGLVGTVLFTDTLTDEGREAGCPASTEGSYSYVVVAAPNDGIQDIDQYDVDGMFRQTLEVTAAENQIDAQFQKGGISTTLPDYDAQMAGSCEDGECSVEFAQLNGDGDTRRTELLSEDGRSLLGTYEEDGGCTDDNTGDLIFESGAYKSTGAYEDLTPVWIENGEVKAFVGKYYRSAEPTELGKTDPSCSKTQTIEAWAYLVDTDIFG